MRTSLPSGELSVVVGHPLADEFLEFCRARCRPNTLVALAWDLKTFFTFVDKTPTRVTSADVLDFIRAQSTGGDRKVVRIDGSSGVSSRTIRRRVSSVSSFYAYLLTRGDTSVTRNPVPRGLATRRERSRPRQGVPLVRNVKTLPRVLAPADVDVLIAAMRTEAGLWIASTHRRSSSSATSTGQVDPEHWPGKGAEQGCWYVGCRFVDRERRQEADHMAGLWSAA